MIDGSLGNAGNGGTPELAPGPLLACVCVGAGAGAVPRTTGALTPTACVCRGTVCVLPCAGAFAAPGDGTIC
jgi:hypothetical protein